MPAHLIGPTEWSMQRDRDGNREYKVTYEVVCDSSLEGPANVLECPGLPQPGDWYIVDLDADLWATCKLDADIKQMTKKEPGFYWEAQVTFSTKPDGKRCKDQQIDDPLLVPPRISGSFCKYQEEASTDRFGNPIVNSAFELLHGPNNEWDGGRPSIKISMNVAQLQLSLLTSMQDKVNGLPLWGLPARCIKLSNISWDKKYYGTCFPYYEINLEFDIRFDTFDRDILDEGTKCINGETQVDDAGNSHWILKPITPPSPFKPPVMPNPLNPMDYNKYTDRKSNPAHCILNGAGYPSGVQLGTGTRNTGGPGYRHVEKYDPANFLLLGIPTQF